MRRRAQGTEHEYTLFSSRLHALASGSGPAVAGEGAGLAPGVSSFDPHQLALELLHRSDLHAAGEFLVNGSRAYLDVGHLELSTCECSGPMELVRYEKAGEKIVDWARKAVEERYLGGGRIWAYKNNTSPDGTSYGSHENYLMDRSVDFPLRPLNELVPHLVSRVIYTGAGDIIDGRYVLSPSAYLTSHLISGNTMHGTGVLNTRDEPHGDAAKYRRLHLLIGDALMSESAILLRQFATSGVIQLMEDGRLEDAPRLEDPVRDMWRNIEATSPSGWGFGLRGGGRVSPLDIQRYYLAKLETIVETDGEARALRLLERVLELIEKRRTREAARWVEWLDRFLAIQEHVSESGEGERDAAMTACKRYSEISEGRSLHYERVRRGLVERVLTDADVLRAIREPPGDTRALLRTRIALSMDVASVDWSRVTVREGGGLREILLDDPLESERGGFDG